MKRFLSPAVARLPDVVPDEVGSIEAGDQGGRSRQLAWSNGLGWVGHGEIKGVTYREQADTTHVI